MGPGASTAVLQTPAADLWNVFDGLNTVEERLVASAVVVFIAIVVGSWVLPMMVRLSAGLIDRQLPDGHVRRWGELLSRYVPTTLANVCLRLLQVSIWFVTILVVMLIWEQVETARDLLHTMGITPGRLTDILLTIGLFVAAYLAANALRELVEQYSDGADQITDHQQEIMIRIGNVALFTVALTGTLTLWGIDLSGLLVGAGFLGIVVGLAARQTLGSLIAGFVLMFSQPFTIGDWVEIGGHEGIVTNITVMNTRMKNFDGESIVMPNDQVSNEPIKNRSAQGHLRVRVDVGVDYETDPEHAEEVALEAIGEAGHVSEAPSPQVIPKAFGDSAVILELRFWIDRPTPARKWRAVGEAIRGVKSAFEAEGIKIPFPQRELSGRTETGEFRVRDGTGEATAPEEVGPSPED
ncbi:mechanosensitive ion channel protein [Halobacteriales archaeon QS_4_66_20]|nr:MAG: mechanosensitive ion channel protein [Halobacteriales archaeon QS_4_66_20]